MRNQACEPCSKRKVRCDREEPCSNCKRRKTDHCSYVDASPQDRIKRLEAIVRKLGADPDGVIPDSISNSTPHASPAKSQTTMQGQEQAKPAVSNTRSNDPVMLEEDGKPFYLESRAWQGWLGHSREDGSSHEPIAKNPFLTEKHPDALSSMIRSASSIDLATKFPCPQHASVLWNTFLERAYPLAKISFSWKLERLYNASIDTSKSKDLSNVENALMFAIYLMGTVNLTEEECITEMYQPRAFFLAEYQALCEEALCRTNIFCITNIQVLEALTFYMMAGVDRLSTQSLWSLMGLIIRNAEKLGVHRDGSVLGLSPVETERRRRVWWHLQHLDLALAIKSGLTPETLKGDCDVKLPLNIEDEDISEDTKEFPEERKGLTSRSYCLYTYWVLKQQQQFFRSDKSRFELSWQTNESLPQHTKDTFLDKLEEGLNDKFLRYCDPLKPIDTLLQISGRFLLCGMRLRTIHPTVCSGKGGAALREEQLEKCMQALEYNIAMNSTPSIKCFRWWTKGMLPWHAFMCVLVESSQQSSPARIRSIWDLLSRLYDANAHLSLLSEDRRRAHAAELIIAAWKTCQLKMNTTSPAGVKLRKPDFVTTLEEKLAERRCETQLKKAEFQQSPNGESTIEQGSGKAIVSVDMSSAAANDPFDFTDQVPGMGGFSMDFQDIDWAFWSSVD